uniref:hypothetical protein n=1 Tax=Asaia astilbis TaxID=610244 RepID=UPI00055C586B
PIDLSVPWAKRIDRTHLASRPVEEHALRASRFGAEGGVGCETTNSASEIGRHCTGRKLALSVWWFWVAFAVLAMPGIFMFGIVEGLTIFVPSAVAGCLLAEFVIVPSLDAWRLARGRASDGDAER